MSFLEIFAYATAASAVLVVAVIVFVYLELSKPPPNGGTPYVLPNKMKIQHWQKSETDFLFTEIWGKESAYSRGGIAFPEGATIIDAGANIGMFTLFAASRCKGDANIISFEPIPTTHSVLSSNAELAQNGQFDDVFGTKPGKRVNIEVRNSGLSDTPADVVFEHHPHFSVWSTQDAKFADQRLQRITDDIPRSLDTNENWFIRACFPRAIAKALAEVVLRKKVGKTERVPVKLETLQSVIESKDLKKIDLLKVDVEGAEEAVLRGIAPHQWPLIQQVVLEVEDFRTKDAICADLSKRGFACSWFASEQERNPGVKSEVCMVYAIRPEYAKEHGKVPGEFVANQWRDKAPVVPRAVSPVLEESAVPIIKDTQIPDEHNSGDETDDDSTVDHAPVSKVRSRRRHA